MKKAILAMAALVLTACEKAVVGEEQQSPNAMLQIRTTRGADDATINYPVQVYVFQGEDCKAVQTIGDEGQTLNIALVEGAYSVYAVGGASSTDYTLPTKDDATTTTAITLKEGKVLTDLMAAQATTTLADGEENTVTLGMERKVMLLQDVTIKQVPTAATELNAIYTAIDDINAAFDTDLNPAGNYLYTTASGAIYYRALSIDSEGNEGFGATARVRPVVTVTIAKE